MISGSLLLHYPYNHHALWDRVWRRIKSGGGGRETTRPVQLDEVWAVYSRSALSLPPCFVFPTRAGRFMRKTRRVRTVSLWLCLHLTFTTGNPGMFTDTWHEETIPVICALWIGDYKKLRRWEKTLCELLPQHFGNFSCCCITGRFTTENVNYNVWALHKHSSDDDFLRDGCNEAET